MDNRWMIYGYGRSYPLVMTNIANWIDPPFSMGKLTISMVIFNSYVKLPEGICSLGGVCHRHFTICESSTWEIISVDDCKMFLESLKLFGHQPHWFPQNPLWYILTSIKKHLCHVFF